MATPWANQQQQRRDPTPPYAVSYPQEQHEQDPQYGANTAVDRNVKREKRRRDMVERVSRLHEDTVARRDRVFHDLSEIFARTADELLPPPVFPTFDLSIPVGQLPPSLPFTDPVIPDMHPTPYLFSLHRLSLQRANQLLAIRLFHLHQVAVARKLFEAETERIEEEYEGAAKGVVERLLEGVEERRRRLTEEKEGDGTSLDSLLGEQSRSHGTRRMRGGPTSRMHTGGRPHLNGSGGLDENGDPLLLAPPNGNGHQNGGSPGPESNPLTSLLGDPNIATGGSTIDPFNIAGTFLPSSHSSSSHPLLSALVGSGANALGPSILGKRKPGPRAQPGLPPAHYSVAAGTYAQFGKSVAGLSALRGDEIEGDLGEVRRKRARHAGGGRGRRLNAE